MKEAFLKFLFIIAILVVIISLIMAMLAAIGAVKSTEGCLYRYNLSDDGALINGDSATNIVSLMAHANYTTISSDTIVETDNSVKITLDPNRYGEWVNTNMAVDKGQIMQFSVRGDISLCKSYLPKNNVQNLLNVNSKDGKRIAIPRIEDTAMDNNTTKDPLSLTFDATIDEWRNIAELYYNDHIVISVSPDQKLIKSDKGAVTRNSVGVKFYDSFTKTTTTTDCSEGQSQYSPVCGRYSVYNDTKYVSGCEFKDNGCMCNVKRCFRDNIIWDNGSEVGDSNCDYWPANMIHSYRWVARSCWCWANVMLPAPKTYKDDGSVNFEGFTAKIAYKDKDINNLFKNFNPQCSAPPQTPVPSPYPESYAKGADIKLDNGSYDLTNPNTEFSFKEGKQKFWFSADIVDGLLYRFDTSEVPTNNKNIGNPASDILKFSDKGYRFAGLLSDQTLYNPNPKNPRFHVIYNDIYMGDNTAYLQYRFPSNATNNNFANRKGGVVLNIKHTKCRRSNGIPMDDAGMKERGRIDYIVVPPGINPNPKASSKALADPTEAKVSYAVQSLVMPDDKTKNGVINIPDSDEFQGYLWMKINNNYTDYKDSFGKYTVQFFTSKAVDSFNIKILNVLVNQFKDRVRSAAEQIFKNMTCYEGDPNKGVYAVTSCTNFFSYIKAMLTLYVMAYAAMFLLGMVQISQVDLVIRVVKIGIVGGLMSHKTFDFFNYYVFDFVTNFSDQIVSNMAGYSMFSNNQTIENPFMFMDSLLTKIFMTKTFISQLLALLSMGVTGVLYFIIIFIALIVMLITIFRAMAIYIMAFMAIAVLIGLTPLFLTFMLFDFTKYLFDNWVRFTFRYMVEPVVLMAGIIIMTQLFTIYLDFAVGYSVCWKCALPIKLPFPQIPGFNPAFANIELFCINWFAPWGFDNRSGMMGLNMQHVIALIIIAYCIYGYADLSSKMVAKLTSTGGPSATSMGNTMSGAAENHMLEKVGLDKKSRAEIKKGIKARLQNRKGMIKDGKVGATKKPDGKSSGKSKSGSDSDNEEGKPHGGSDE